MNFLSFLHWLTTATTLRTVYDNTLELNMRKEHIIDDNFDRFIEAGYNSKELINVLLDAAKVTLEKKLKREF